MSRREDLGPTGGRLTARDNTGRIVRTQSATDNGKKEPGKSGTLTSSYTYLRNRVKGIKRKKRVCARRKKGQMDLSPRIIRP